MLPYCIEQLTSYCSEREMRPLPAIAHAASVEPVVENAQQEPHAP